MCVVNEKRSDHSWWCFLKWHSDNSDLARITRISCVCVGWRVTVRDIPTSHVSPSMSRSYAIFPFACDSDHLHYFTFKANIILSFSYPLSILLLPAARFKPPTQLFFSNPSTVSLHLGTAFQVSLLTFGSPFAFAFAMPFLLPSQWIPRSLRFSWWIARFKSSISEDLVPSLWALIGSLSQVSLFLDFLEWFLLVSCWVYVFLEGNGYFFAFETEHWV